MKKSIYKIEKENCTGCKMCADICPFGAISFEEDHEGFWYPKVDEEKCTDCGACAARCPSMNREQIKQQREPLVYAAWSKDEETRISSTSGGIFYEIGRWFITHEGGVAACRYTSDYKAAEHVYVEDLEGLEQVKGSKYFQSDTAGIYKKVKEKLDAGKKVLFCGAPCHMAAMQMYLNKEYDNLYYLDFICRSINSPLAFREYLKELEQEYGAKVSEVQLKNKKYGWQSLASRVRFENGEESIKDRNSDWWIRGFIYNDLYTRESCYHCKYKVLPRVAADMSIGDFWGIKDQTEKDMFEGISVVLVNSEKGSRLLEEIRPNLEIRESSMEEALPGNPALLNNPVRTKRQDKFFRQIKKHPFSKSVSVSTHVTLASRIKSKLKKILHYSRVMIFNPYGIDRRKFFYWNYIAKNVIRSGSAKLIPYHNAVINIDKTAKLYLKGQNLEIGINKLKNSKSETHLRMEENSVWHCNNGCGLFYNTVLELKNGAQFDSGYFTANGGSVIIIQEKMTFGEDVMLGRNIIVYDSDFHHTLNEQGRRNNCTKAVVIEDHVWLTNNITVTKGVTIGKGSLITTQTQIRKDVPPHSVVAGGASGKIISDTVRWER